MTNTPEQYDAEVTQAMNAQRLTDADETENQGCHKHGRIDCDDCFLDNAMDES